MFSNIYFKNMFDIIIKWYLLIKTYFINQEIHQQKDLLQHQYTEF